jgi:TELO2-interacting protein 1
MIGIDLAQQLIILLTFFAGGEQTTLSIPEELQTQAYGVLAALFRLVRSTPKGAASLVEVSTIPAVGHCLTVILDGIADGPSSQTQVEATLALKSFWSCIKDREVLANFLPGTVSALTRCLVPNTTAPRSRRVLVNALEALQLIITSILSDIATRSLPDDGDGANAGGNQAQLTKSWLRATASQIKLALVNIIKLRSHRHSEVQKALLKLCLAILDECHSSLTDCVPLLVETALTLESFDQEIGDFPEETTLGDLANIHQIISESVKIVTYNWITSLPRVMQSNDEAAKQTALRQLSKVNKLFSNLGSSSELLTSALSDALRDSVVSMLQMSASSRRGVSEVSVHHSGNSSLLLSAQSSLIKAYSPIVMPYESQIQTRQSLDALIAGVGSPDMQIKMAREMLELLRTSGGNDLLSAFWLAFQLIRSATASSSALDAFVCYPSTPADEIEAAMLELYTYSVSVISDDVDWQMQAISLEVVAYTAQVLGESFRPDLVDVLYPIVHFLGSANIQLREHAIVSLNLISDSCGYRSTSEMVVKNVDYLVNAISLKLDSFDISPQVPQVLIMMLRLTGSSLLPYLDDLVVSIFAALDNFHGYTRLVESLFTVLREIVEKSRESSQLELTSNPGIDHRKKRPAELCVDDIVMLFNKKTDRAPPDDQGGYHDFPKEPWKSATTLLDEINSPQEGAEENKEANTAIAETDKPPQSKVYMMVQSIVRLSQHYLTNESPFLRQNLLQLISIACQTMCRDEDQFLPLINDIWPVLIKRLYDGEPFVVIAASKAVAEVCKCAGDFMSTRMQVEWQDIMRSIHQAKAQAQAEKQGRHGRGVYSQNWQVWEAFVQLLVVILEYVRINDAMFDEVLEVLAGLLGSRADVRDALSVINADAVWLEELRQGQYPNVKMPVMEGFRFSSLDVVKLG